MRCVLCSLLSVFLLLLFRFCSVCLVCDLRGSVYSILLISISIGSCCNKFERLVSF